MFPCKKGHPHKTAQGCFDCNLKYADRRVKREMDKGPRQHRKIVHKPAKVVDKGIIKVYIYQEAEVVK